MTVRDLGTQVRRSSSHRGADAYICSWLQFFLGAEDLGKSRAEVTVPRLAELNSYVPIRNLEGRPGQGITVDDIKGFQVHKSFTSSYAIIDPLPGDNSVQHAAVEAA